MRYPAIAAVTFSLLFATPAAFADQAAAVSKPADSKLKIAKTDVAITIDDMHCAGCAKKISSRLFKLKGVVKVRTDLKANLAVITPQAKKQVDVKAAWEAIQKAGFQPTKLVGPQGTYVAHEKTKAPEKVADAETEPAKRS
jgi:copper chaperone CopZ